MQLRSSCTFLTRGISSVAAVLFFAIAPGLHAQRSAAVAQNPASQGTHLVSPAQMQQKVTSASAARQKNIASLTKFLSSPMAVRKMKSEHIDPVQVNDAIPNLSNSELASLAARADHAQQAFAAGTLSNNDLLIIILVLVVVILLAVIH